MAIRPDLWPRTWNGEKRIVRDCAAVRLDAHNLAEMSFEILRTHREVLLLPLAQSHKQRAIAREHQARAEMSVAVHGRHLAKYHFDIAQLVVTQLRPRHRSAIATVATFC